jgi:hypothetical protein
MKCGKKQLTKLRNTERKGEITFKGSKIKVKVSCYVDWHIGVDDKG